MTGFYFMATLIIHPLILFILLCLFARHNADLGPLNVFFVALGMGIGGMVIHLALTPRIGIFSVLVMLFFGLFMLMRFLAVSIGRALIVLLLHTAACFWVAHLVSG